MSPSTGRVFLILCWAVTVCQPFPYRFGVVTPHDPFIFVGDELVLHCNITNADLLEDSSYLGFQRSSHHHPPYIIPKEYIQIVTSKTIRLRIPDLTLEEDGNYVCFQRTIGNENRTIGSQIVRVDYRPSRVETIDCLVYNWSNMTCNWTLGVDFKYPEMVSVRLVWAIDGRQQDCPELTNQSCRWPTNIYQPGAIYYMGIVVKTIRSHGQIEIANASSPQFTVHTSRFVKPAPVRHFQAREMNSTCIRLSWKHPTPKDTNKTFDVMYKEAGSNHWKGIKAEYEIHKEEDYSWKAILSKHLEDIYNYKVICLVCGLTPFTSYNFKVSVLPYPEGSYHMEHYGHRSDWISVPATTREDIPGISPPLCHSCFYLSQCEDRKTGKRCVRIYWGETPVTQRHGNFTKYTLLLAGEQTPLDTILSPEVTNTNLTISNGSYEARLTSATLMGQSRPPSIINIPADGAIMPPTPQNFLVQTDARRAFLSTYYLSWDSLPPYLTRVNTTKITVVWCIAGPVYYMCRDYINLIPLSGDRENLTFTPRPEERSYVKINIGIAVETLDQGITTSSGLHWASCLYYRNQKPVWAPENVQFVKSSPSGALTVRWQKPDCTREKAFIQMYKVKICATEDGKTCLKGEPPVIRDAHKTEFTFKQEVEPFINYIVSIAASNGRYVGPWSPAINATVEPTVGQQPGDDYKDVDVIIVIVVTIFLVILIFLIIKCICCCRERHYLKERDLGRLNLQPELKQPLNQPSRFQDRPLPEPPTAALHYYGLNACMTNLGSSQDSTGSSHYSVNSNQARPLVNGKGPSEPLDAKEYHYLLPMDERGSSSSSGTASDIGSSTKSTECEAQAGWFPDQGNTLQLRTFPSNPRAPTFNVAGGNNAGMGVNIGQVKDEPENTKHEQIDATTTLSKTATSPANIAAPAATDTEAPEIPSSPVPPLPCRLPLKDNPPLNHAPPPPLTEKTKPSSIHRHSSAPTSSPDYIIQSIHPDFDPSPIFDPPNCCDNSTNTFKHPSHTFGLNTSLFGNANEDALPGDAICGANSTNNEKQFMFPPPPSSPPSPVPSPQHTCVLPSPLTHTPQIHSLPEWLVNHGITAGIHATIDPSSFITLNEGENDIDDNTINQNPIPCNEHSIESPAILDLNQEHTIPFPTLHHEFQSITPTPSTTTTDSPTTSSSASSSLPYPRLPDQTVYTAREDSCASSSDDRMSMQVDPTIGSSHYIQCSEVPHSSVDQNSFNLNDYQGTVFPINELLKTKPDHPIHALDRGAYC